MTSPTGLPASETGRWLPLFAPRFAPDEGFGDWLLEGAGELGIDGAGTLRIAGTKRMVDDQEVGRHTCWCTRVFSGDLRYRFELRCERGNGFIFFFNALPGAGAESLFSWQRPRANYVDYTGDPRLRMYTLGLGRHDDQQINFRYLGGENAALVGEARDPGAVDPDRQGRFAADFQTKSIQVSVPSPFGDPERFYGIDICVVGARIQASVDGQLVLDHVDRGHEAQPLAGGCFAFRNFHPTTTWVRGLTVCQREG